MNFIDFLLVINYLELCDGLLVLISLNHANPVLCGSSNRLSYNTIKKIFRCIITNLKINTRRLLYILEAFICHFFCSVKSWIFLDCLVYNFQALYLSLSFIM